MVERAWQWLLSVVSVGVQVSAQEADAPLPVAPPGPPPAAVQPIEVTFTSNRGGSLAIWSVPRTGGEPRRITDGGSDVAPAWSPDGRTLAFHSHRSGGWKIWLVEFDADDRPGRARRLTDSGAGAFRYEYFPCWSPDGRQIAFERWNDAVGRFELCVIGRDGRGERTVGAGEGHDRQPSWSPDGRRLLFTSQRDGNAEIYVVDVEGGAAPQNLSRSPAVDYAAAFAPDGERILFHSDRGGRFATWTMAADGGDVRAFAPITTDDHLQGWTDTESNTRSIPYRALRSTAGVWSADGTSVLATTVRSGDEELCLLDASGGTPRRVIASNPARDFLPVFRPRQ
ncbi:MAG: PD40 domain-containing protein [Planctomycetes bacterium]|nr:PD40 domain-containing protein [Planctomycetota bacterium]